MSWDTITWEHVVASDDLLEELLAARPTPTFGRTFAEEIADPSTGQRRQCYLALRAASLALAMHQVPIDVIDEAMDAVPGGKSRSDRVKALAYAVEVLRCVPEGSRGMDAAALRDAVTDLSVAERDTLLEDHPSLPVVTPSGRTWFLEAHPATHPGGTHDQWMDRRVAAHDTLGRALPRYAGVAVITGRRRDLSVHRTAGQAHLLGGCGACEELRP